MATGPEKERRSARAARQARWAPDDRAVLGALGALMRQARRAAGLTIAELARAVDVDPSYLGELERGRANISVTTLAAIGRALGVPLRELIPDGGAQEGVGEEAGPRSVE